VGRRRSFVSSLVQAQRKAEQLRLAQVRAAEKAHAQAVKNAEKARKDYEKAQRADQKERARLYNESRVAQTDVQNKQLEQNIAQLTGLLADALSVNSSIDFQQLKETLSLPTFNPGSLAIPEPPPVFQNYIPPEPGGIQKLFPGVKERYAQDVAKAENLYKMDVAAHTQREQARQQRFVEVRTAFERQVAEIQQRSANQHAEIDKFAQEFGKGSPEAIVDYFTIVLSSSAYPDNFPQRAKVGYVPESKQLVVEYDLPSFEIIPEFGSFKYVKNKDEIQTIARSQAQRKALYSSVIAQVTLRTLYELFQADRKEYISILVFNGYVDSIDKGTGHTQRACLITVRTSRDVFKSLNLARVDPQTCLATLNASVSKSPAELAPVRPVLEFKMVDPRFIEEVDVLSGLDQRMNLMELSPFEFESLIANLFQKMGLETRQTQASRDGGVDCVAFDPRPIFGGKVVIQAKRYKGTVGVSAVRDLYGTMQNEGASKGYW